MTRSTWNDLQADYTATGMIAVLGFVLITVWFWNVVYFIELTHPQPVKTYYQTSYAIQEN